VNSKRLWGIVIGSSIGGLFVVFIMLMLFSPGLFLKTKLKQVLSRASGGNLWAEDITFGWRKGLELFNLVLLTKERKRPTLKAQRMRLKIAVLPLLRGQYVLRELEASDLEVIKGLVANLSQTDVSIDALRLEASHLTFSGELNMRATPGQKGMGGRNGLTGGGLIRLEKGLLTGNLVSIVMEALGQPEAGYACESIFANFDVEEEGHVHLRNFLAKSLLFDLELVGWVRADDTLDCDATVILTKEKVNKKVQKLFHLSGADTFRIPVRLKGSLSSPKVSIKTESMVEELFRGIFQEK
jgi:hypothetical protein